jgi:hypothetical protein
MTDTTITPTLNGRKLWGALRHKHNAYDVLVHDGEAFAWAMLDRLCSNGFEPLTGEAYGGEERKRYDARRQAVYDYLESHDIDPELRRLIGAMDDSVYDFAGQTFNEGMAFATATEKFRNGLLGMTKQATAGN